MFQTVGPATGRQFHGRNLAERMERERPDIDRRHEPRNQLTSVTQVLELLQRLSRPYA